MPLNFVYDEKASSYEQLLQDSIYDLFSELFNDQDEDAKNDRMILNFILGSHKKYLKSLRKKEKRAPLVKGGPNSRQGKGAKGGKIAGSFQNKQSAQSSSNSSGDASSAQASIADIGATDLSKRRSLEDLSNEHSIFTDFAPMYANFLSLPEGTPQDMAIIDDAESGSIQETACEFGQYQGILTTAINKSMVRLDKLENLELDDHLLLNSSALFSKLPQWSLNIDLGDKMTPDSEGNRFTGVTLYRIPFFKSKGATNVSFKALPDEPNLIYSGIGMMLATNHTDFGALDFTFEIRKEESIARMLRRAFGPFILNDLDEASAEDLGFNEGDESPIPVDVLQCIAEVFKAATYVMTHLYALKDDKGQAAMLENIKDTSFITTDKLNLLAEKASYTNYYL